MTHQLLQDVREAGVIATLRAPNAEAAYGAVEALVRGGVTAIEVTYSTPNAGAVIAELGNRFGHDIVLGAGTLTTTEQVEEASESGARFLVSPGFDEEIFDAIRATGAMSMIGGFTPTEVQNLAKRGADVVKFFPGGLGGPATLKALRGPFPGLTYIPTGGVNAENLGQWLAAGAIAVGAGSELIPAAALAQGDYDAIEVLARRFMAALSEARASS
jgi:2-dehydro-3-deoxyphosphogluconate aldolase/(4S)-4-hydroxy-2-oxoglutarate aldolase